MDRCMLVKAAEEEEEASRRSPSISAMDWIQDARSPKAALRKENARMAVRSWALDRQMNA
jgi:hypothetical protein